MYKLRPN